MPKLIALRQLETGNLERDQAGHKFNFKTVRDMKTKKQYENYLNEIGNSLSEEEFIIAGKRRFGNYGSLLRKHDPVAFSVGYNEYILNI